MKTKLPLFAFMLAILVGCSDRDEVLRNRIESELGASLSVGDSAEKIERVLKEKGMSFSFDGFVSRYQTGVDPKEKRMVERVVSVWIYVDEKKQLTKIEVRNTYTFF